MKIMLIAVLILLSIAQSVLATDITLSWTDNSNNEDGFRIERKVDAGAYAFLQTIGSNIVTYVDTVPIVNPLADTTYCYRLAAFNSTGSSASSNEACLTLKKPVPGVPTIVDIKCTACTVIVNGQVIVIP